jgi:hypothetical protein
MTLRRTHLNTLYKLDRSIGDLRRRRQGLVNRVKLQFWVERRCTPALQVRRKSAAG